MKIGLWILCTDMVVVLVGENEMACFWTVWWANWIKLNQARSKRIGVDQTWSNQIRVELNHQTESAGWTWSNWIRVGPNQTESELNQITKLNQWAGPGQTKSGLNQITKPNQWVGPNQTNQSRLNQITKPNQWIKLNQISGSPAIKVWIPMTVGSLMHLEDNSCLGYTIGWNLKFNGWCLFWHENGPDGIQMLN